jgi:DNA-binding phage protein
MMSTPRRIARFTEEVSAEGLLDQMLDQLPPEEIAAALAGIARDRGYAVHASDLKQYLRGLDARQD